MDSLSHIVLGGALAQLLAGPRAGYRRSFLLGALAATLPDLDMFIHTGNAVRDHMLHRHFSHALVTAPALALLAVAILCIQKAARVHGKRLFLAALLAVVSHIAFDALTSYGTMMF